jgi:hypothetical protein
VTLKLGIIGLSEGNGHPFSFSAIINGYSDAGLADSGWPVIYEYVRRRDPSEFEFADARVTHAWTQDPDITQRLCRACRIPHAVDSLEALLGNVDAVILARDDYSEHLHMAMPFLKAGLPVFIDKPLTVEPKELEAFRPYLESGQLMSCSGMRFATELDVPRAQFAGYGQVHLIRGAILNDWEKYGIHLIDAILNVTPARPVAVTPLRARHQSLAVAMDDGSCLQLDALGKIGRCFRVDIFGERKISTHEITDNFSMFRRLLFHFIRGVKLRQPAIPPADTLTSIRLLIAGRQALLTNRSVELHEVGI